MVYSDLVYTVYCITQHLEKKKLLTNNLKVVFDTYMHVFIPTACGRYIIEINCFFSRAKRREKSDALTWWPVQAKFEDNYFSLAPSEPSVKKLNQSSKTFHFSRKSFNDTIEDQKNSIANNHPLLEKILKVTNDQKSIPFYKKIINSCSEWSIVNALEDIETYQLSGRKINNIGALFTSRIKKSNPYFQ